MQRKDPEKTQVVESQMYFPDVIESSVHFSFFLQQQQYVGFCRLEHRTLALLYHKRTEAENEKEMKNDHPLVPRTARPIYHHLLQGQISHCLNISRTENNNTPPHPMVEGRNRLRRFRHSKPMGKLWRANQSMSQSNVLHSSRRRQNYANASHHHQVYFGVTAWPAY